MGSGAIRSGAVALVAIKAKLAAFALALTAVLAGAVAFLAASAGPAEALPSYARQTGQPCAACHTAFPELTPVRAPLQDRRLHNAGRRLDGPAGRGDVHGRLHAHEFAVDDAPPARGLCTRTTISFRSRCPASSRAGSTAILVRSSRSRANPVAGTACPSTRPTFATPTRSSCSARTRSGASTPTTRPTVEDPWNTTPSFGWPQISSTIAPAFGPPLTHIEERIWADRRRRRSLRLLERHALRRLHGLQRTSGSGAAGVQRRQFDDRRCDQRRALLACSRSSRIGASII